MPLFHPDVTVVLSYSSLWIQKRKTDAAFSTQPGIVAATVFYGFFVELVPKSVKEREKQSIKEQASTFPRTMWGGGVQIIIR